VLIGRYYRKKRSNVARKTGITNRALIISTINSPFPFLKFGNCVKIPHDGDFSVRIYAKNGMYDREDKKFTRKPIDLSNGSLLENGDKSKGQRAD
jgi:hypothetical protein